MGLAVLQGEDVRKRDVQPEDLLARHGAPTHGTATSSTFPEAPRRGADDLWEGRLVYAVAARDRCVLVEAWLGMHRPEQG